jgi:hypothetical protein
MSKSKTLLWLVAALSVGAGLAFGYMKWSDFKVWSKNGGAVHSGPATEILVMRTKGGLLEVSRIRATEQFDTKYVYSVIGFKVGETVPHIRVPATYRYHIELAPEWRIIRTGSLFTVVTPPVKPSLPVAVDLEKIEKDVLGTWLLVPFNQSDDLDALERKITPTLAGKAASAEYLQLQREQARKTVTEFVKKWLVTQTPWTTEVGSTVRVYFADEPIGSFGPQAFPQLAPDAKAEGVEVAYEE